MRSAKQPKCLVVCQKIIPVKRLIHQPKVGSILVLTVGTKMGGTPCQFQALNGSSTNAAGLTFTVVDPGGAAIVAINALDIQKGAETGAADGNTGLQHIDNGLLQPLNLRWLEVGTPCIGSNPALEQRLIGIDIADTRYQGLIE